MPNIFIIGAGQLGSRHLQALKAVKDRLSIIVIDPSKKSLAVAKERYESIDPKDASHALSYTSRIPTDSQDIDIVIVATNSDVRSKVVQELLSARRVKYLILEKLLFSKFEDFNVIGQLIKKKDVRAWVNCPMRMMPYYQILKNQLGEKIFYHVSGGQFGLVTNAIHHIDYISYLTGSNSYILDTDLLDIDPIPSKRKGFIEFNGTLRVVFDDGSLGVFSCYPDGNAPIQVEISDHAYRTIIKEHEGKALVSKASEDWKWQEIDAKIPYQSQMTTDVVNKLLSNGTCPLAPFEDSITLHIPLLEGLRTFLNKHTNKYYKYYPFT